MSTSVDIPQFSSRHPSSLGTSISYQTDIRKNLCDHPSAFYGRPSVFKLTYVSFYIDVHHYLSGLLPAFTRTSISNTLDVCFIGSQLVPLVTSISFHLDIHHLCGHPSATQQTSIRTAVDVHQLSYGRPSVFMLTSISFYIDIHQYLSRRPSGFIRMSICTSVDVCQLS